MAKKLKFKAFTLIELLVAIAIIGTIIVVTTLAFSKIGENSRNSSRLADIQEVQLALEEYHKYESSYPEELIFGGPLIGPRSGKTFLTLLPQNPDPRNDGDCPDENYRYEHFPETDSYHLYFCLGDEVSDLRSGPKIAKPSGIGEPFACGKIFTDSRDGNSYPTVKIGDQCWMAKNLAYLPIVNKKNEGSASDPRYYVYGYDGNDNSIAKSQDNYNVYGVLYNWPAAKTSCPDAWRLPNDNDWEQLKDYLGGELIAGGKMKSTTTDWYGSNEGATNESGFTALPAGRRNYKWDVFDDLFECTIFWSASYEGLDVFVRGLLYFHSYLIFYNNYSPEYGLSVRCLLD